MSDCRFGVSPVNYPDPDLRAFIPVLVSTNLNDNSIKNEWASMETPFSHYKSMGFSLDLKGG